MKGAQEPSEEEFDYDDEEADFPGELPLQFGSDITGDSRGLGSETEQSVQTLDMTRMSQSARSLKGKRKISNTSSKLEPVQSAGCCAGGKKCVIF